MAKEADSVGKASVEIVADIVISEESKAEAKAQLAELANADVSTPEGRRGGRGRSTTTQTVDAKVQTKLKNNIQKDIQSAIDKDEYRLTIDTLNIREQIQQALKAPFQVTIDAEVRGAQAQAGVGVAHSPITATGAPMGRGEVPPEITKLLTKGMKDAIDNVYRNVNDAYAAANKGSFGRQSVEPGNHIEKAVELIDRFGGKFSDMLNVQTNKAGIPSIKGGSLSGAELGKALGIDPKHPALQALTANAMGFTTTQPAGGITSRNADVFFSRLGKWATSNPMTAQPAAAVEQTVTPRHEDRALAREQIAQNETALREARQAVIDERQKGLTQAPLSSAAFPVTPPLRVAQTERGDVETDARARRALGGGERANVRRLRGRGTPVGFGAQSVDLESYLRAAEMGQFQDVFERFGGKGSRESEGLVKFDASNAEQFDELSRLGRRKPGVKFGMAGQEGRYARVNPSEALIRTIIKDLGIAEDQPSAEQVRSELTGRPLEQIRQAIERGSSPRRSVSGETKRGQGSVGMMAGGDAAKRLQLFDEWIGYAEDRSAQLGERLAKITPAIERASKKRDTGKVRELEEAARGISSELQSMDSGIAEAVIDRRELLEAANPKEQIRLTHEQIARRNKLSKAGVAAGVGFTETERLDRQLNSPGAQGRFGGLLMSQLGMDNPGEQIRSALLQRYLGDTDRPEGRTGRSTMRQAAYGPTSRARRAPGQDEGILGELMTAAEPAGLGRDATKTLRDSIIGILNSTLEDEGFKRDIAEAEIAKKEGATLRPLRMGVTGEGQYTTTPPGIIGALQARIATEEKFPVGHTAAAHGPKRLVETHEELEDQGEVPGLRTRLRSLQERDEIIRGEEAKAAATRQRSISGKKYQTGDQTTAAARAAGVTMEGEGGGLPWAAFAAKYGGGGAGASGGGGGGFGGVTGAGGAVPVFVTNWPAGGSGGGGRRPPRGRVTDEEEQPGGGGETGPGKPAKNLKLIRPIGVTTTAAERYDAEQRRMRLQRPIGVTTTAAERYEAEQRKLRLQKPLTVTTTAAQRAAAADQARQAELADLPFRNASTEARIGERAAAQAKRVQAAQERRDRRNIRTNDPLGLAQFRDTSDDELEKLRGQNRRVQRFVPRRGFGASLVDLVTANVGGKGFEGQLEAADRAQRELNEINSTAEKRNVSRTQLQGTLAAARSERGPDGRLSERGKALFAAAGLIQKDINGQGLAIRESTKRFLENAKAATAASTVLKSFGAAAVGSIVSTGIGALTVGLGMAVAAPLIQGVGEGVSAALGPILERATGFGGTTGRVQGEVATAFRTNNDDLRATLAQQGIAARLTDSQLAAISGPLGQRGANVAGAQNAAQQFDLLNASRAIDNQRQGGFDRSLFRTTGGLFDFQGSGPLADISVGGQASVAETLAGQLKNLVNPDDIARHAQTLPSIADNLGIGDNFATRQANDQAAANKLIADNNKQLGFLNANLKGSKFSLAQGGTPASLDQQRDLFAAAGAQSLGEALSDAKITVQGIDPTGKPFEEIGAFLKTFVNGQELSPQQILATDSRAIQAQRGVEDAQRELALRTTNPQTFALNEVQRPLAPAATGINTAGLSPAQVKTVNAELTQTQKLYDQINADVATGVQQAKDFVSGQLGAGPGAEFGKSLDHVAAIGKEISNIEIGVQTKQAAFAAAQFSYQIDIAKRSLKDAKELMSGVGSGLGAVERQMYDLQRQSQALGLGQSQKQINFQTAIAGFQAPGLTSEEREARMNQAKVEAAYAQKQLDIQKQLFGLGGKQFKIQGTRQVQDLSRQVDLLVRGRTLTIETAVSEKRIAALTKIQAKENKQVETFYNAAVQRTNDVIAEQGKLVAATGKAMRDIGTIVLKEFRSAYTGMIDIISGGGAKNSSGSPDDRNRNASGFLGTVSGTTSLGKLGVAGEAAGEAVAIIKNPQQLVSPMGGSGGGDQFIVQIYNPVVKSEDDKRKLIADVKRALQQEASLLLPRRA